MNLSEINIGAKIRLYRKRKGFSLHKLSELTGIAASNLSSIELNKTSPTLQTLARISDAFEVKIGEFLNGILYKKVVICEPYQTRRSGRRRNQVSEYILTSDTILNRLEAKILDFPVDSGPISAPLENTDRFVFVLTGDLLLTSDDENAQLRAGQGVYLSPEAEAKLENRGSTSARALVTHTTN